MSTEFQDFASEFDGPAVDEERIRKEYRNLETVKVPYVSKYGHAFIIAKILDVDERGGDIGTSPLVYKSGLEEDGENALVLASHALQTEQGVAYVLRKLRIEFCDGNLDEAVKIVDESKRALGMDCEEYIALLRAEAEPARALMAAHKERTKELAAASAPETKKLSEGEKEEPKKKKEKK